MNPRSPQQSRDQHAYIPQHVSDAMSKQMQQNVPAHLKQYVNPDKPVYVPKHVEQQLNQHMQKTMPGHLKGYSGAYVQQKVVQPGLAGPSSQGPRPVAPVAPTPNQLRQDHSNVNAGQYEARFNNNLFASDQPGQPAPQPPTGYPPQPSQAPPNQPPEQPYDFIMNSGQPAPKSPLPGLSPGASLPQKILMGLGALLVLVIVAAIVRSVFFSNDSNFTGYMSVVQDQQQLIQLLQPKDQIQTDALANANQAFVSTASLSLTSSQRDLMKYLAANGQKIDAKQLNLKIDPQNNQKLAAAATAGTYNQTFKEVMQAELTQYMNSLTQAYNTSTGKNGRALLDSQYGQADLLLKQLEQQ